MKLKSALLAAISLIVPVSAQAQAQKNQPAEQRQNKQQRRIVVQHVNGTAEDMPSQQDQAQQSDAGVPRSSEPTIARSWSASAHERPSARTSRGRFLRSVTSPT